MATNVSTDFASSEAIHNQLVGLIPVLVYLHLIVIIGLTGNSFVFYVYYTKFRLSAASTFFIWLSLVNIVCCCVVIPVEIFLIFTSYSLQSESLCKFSRFCNSWSTISTGTILVAIAADRYRKICKLSWRQLNKRKARLASVACVVAGLLFSWPSLVLFGKKRTIIPGSSLNGTQCALLESVESTFWPMLYEIMYALVFTSGVVFVTFWYWQIYKKIKSQARKTNSMTSLASIQSFKSGLDTELERSKSLDQLPPFLIEEKPDVEIVVSKSDSCLNSDADYSPKLQRRVTWKEKAAGRVHVEDLTNQNISWKSNEVLIASLGLPPRRRSILKRRYTARTPRRNVNFGEDDQTTESSQNSADDVKVLRSHSLRFDRERNNFSSFKYPRRRPTFTLKVQAPSDENLDSEHNSTTEESLNTNEINENKVLEDNQEETIENHVDSAPKGDDAASENLKSDDNSEMDSESVNDSDFQTPGISLIVRRNKGSILKAVSAPVLSPRTIPDPNGDLSPEDESRDTQMRQPNGTLDDSSEIENTEIPKRRKRTSSITDFVNDVLPLSWTERRISWRVYTARRTAYIMCLITISAIFCYLPVLCLETLRALVKNCEQNMSDSGRSAYNFFLRSYFLNVAISPFVYGAFDAKFRSACRDIVRGSIWRLRDTFHI